MDKTADSVDGCRRYEVTLTIIGESPSKPVDVILVIDRSGSMGYNGSQSLSATKAAAKHFAQTVLADTNNRVGVVSYSAGSLLDQELTYNLTAVENAINNLSASGYTNIKAGFNRARDHMASDGRPTSSTARAIVLLSDGVANVA